METMNSFSWVHIFVFKNKSRDFWIIENYLVNDEVWMKSLKLQNESFSAIFFNIRDPQCGNGSHPPLLSLSPTLLGIPPFLKKVHPPLFAKFFAGKNRPNLPPIYVFLCNYFVYYCIWYCIWNIKLKIMRKLIKKR